MKFRFARHTNNLEKLKSFYTTVLGLEVLGSFENHATYDGVFLGKQNLNWYLEFTQSDEIVEFNFNEDDILVFYPETLVEYDSLIENINKNRINFTTSKNPYWNQNGKMVLDPDGYRIIISNLKVK
ncbi:VOC family protein [Flavobacterium terrigena]|uniref:Glyoxalase-like domain-containing protein n=1 Tax=Flavobacterium terrigena TaxID=402734 RepID=A0A1H6VXB2_9FLAO|nr:VOC family protein [Flavobacterium terrigena]SEJ09279.1 Glyoxalase-like domain-containing protein [Flavobacterium terrigena]